MDRVTVDELELYFDLLGDRAGRVIKLTTRCSAVGRAEMRLWRLKLRGVDEQMLDAFALINSAQAMLDDEWPADTASTS